MVKASLKKQNPPTTNTPKKKITKPKPKSKHPPSPSPSPSPSSDSDTEPNTPDQILKLISPYTKDHLIDLIITAAVKNPTLYTDIINSAGNDVSHRKIFVYGLGWDTTKETLTSAFEGYGEIEDCHVVLDRDTGKAKGFGFVQFRYRKGANKALKEPKKRIGNRMANCQLAALGKSRGFALFIYRSQDGFRKCLEEPVKMFEGCKLHCQKAADGKNKGVASVGPAPVVQQATPQMMAAVAASQNFGMFGQGQLGLGLNHLYGQLIVDPNTGLIAANPMYGLGQVGGVGGAPGGLSGYYGGVPGGLNVGVDSASLLGGYGGAASPVLPGVGLQNVYPEKKEGSSSASGSRSQGAGGSYSGYPSRMR